MGAGNDRIEWRFHVHGSCARTGAAVSVSIDAATDEEAQARAWDAVPELDVSEIERTPNTLIMSCTAGKLAKRCQARDLYQGRAWDLARAADPDHWRLMVLSAEHGLIPDNWVIDPYDRCMTPERAAELAHPAMACKYACLLRHASGQLYVYGGAAYRTLAGLLAHDAGRTVRPLVGAGRGCGDHFSALKRAVGGAV